MEILKEIIAADKAAAARVEALRAQQENSLAESGRAADIANEKQTAEARSELDKFIAEQTRALTEKQQNSTGESPHSLLSNGAGLPFPARYWHTI